MSAIIGADRLWVKNVHEKSGVQIFYNGKSFDSLERVHGILQQLPMAEGRKLDDALAKKIKTVIRDACSPATCRPR